MRTTLLLVLACGALTHAGTAPHDFPSRSPTAGTDRLVPTLAGWDGEESLTDVMARRREQIRRQNIEREAAEKTRLAEEQQRLKITRAQQQNLISTVEAGVRLRGMTCYAEPHVAVATLPQLPTGSCVTIDFTASCPGNTAWQTAGRIDQLDSDHTGCQGKTIRIPAPPCDPALLDVVVGKVRVCERE